MRTSQPQKDLSESYTAFVLKQQDALRRALIAGFGPEVGREAAEEALVYGWRHWPRVRTLDNPTGYLYRVGHRMAIKLSRPRPRPVFPVSTTTGNPDVEPRLPEALAHLSERQRAVVVLIHAYGLSQREAARLLGLSKGSVQRHLERGLQRLRSELGVIEHA